MNLMEMTNMLNTFLLLILNKKNIMQDIEHITLFVLYL